MLRAEAARCVVHISARADYAVRAALELALSPDAPVKGEALARAQDIPPKFLEGILSTLRRAGLVRSQRGAEGGYWLARPAEDISVADVIRAVDGPLAGVRGLRPEDVSYDGAATALGPVWVAVRANLRLVLEHVSLAQVAGDRLPAKVRRLAADPEAWITR
ncbi:MAG: transcriptional regulator [Frankiales bacterium]|nr:transcriptional regulator [Frankiales bacterium]